MKRNTCLILALLIGFTLKSHAAKAVEGKLDPFLGKPVLESRQVFKNGRMPNVVVAMDGSVLAFWNGVICRRSEDGGETFAKVIEVGKGFMGGGVTVDETTGYRCSSPVQLQDQRGQVVFEGTTKDERFDANDHLTAAVKRGTTYQLSIPLASGERLVKTLTVETGGQMVQVEVPSDE